MNATLFILTLLLSFVSLTALAQEPGDTELYEPVPEVVEPGNSTLDAPSDAIILFDGTSFDEWVSSSDGEDVEWIMEGDHMTVRPRTGGIQTRRNFEDIQLHIEWRAPAEISGQGQGRGNSGIFIQNRYEVQVLDNWDNMTYYNGMAGSIYKQHIPLVNPAKRPGEWQSYDIFYTSPDFNEDGNVESPARITVLLNGVLVQNNVQLYGPTEYIGQPEYQAHGPAPISLQDHSNPVSFRNIWIRELNQDIIHSDGINGNNE